MIDISAVREALEEMKREEYTVDPAFIAEAIHACERHDEGTEPGADLVFIVNVLRRAAILL